MAEVCARFGFILDLSDCLPQATAHTWERYLFHKQPAGTLTRFLCHAILGSLLASQAQPPQVHQVLETRNMSVFSCLRGRREHADEYTVIQPVGNSIVLERGLEAAGHCFLGEMPAQADSFVLFFQRSHKSGIKTCYLFSWFSYRYHKMKKVLVCLLLTLLLIFLRQSLTYCGPDWSGAH